MVIPLSEVISSGMTGMMMLTPIISIKTTSAINMMARLDVSAVTGPSALFSIGGPSKAGCRMHPTKRKGCALDYRIEKVRQRNAKCGTIYRGGDSGFPVKWMSLVQVILQSLIFTLD